MRIFVVKKGSSPSKVLGPASGPQLTALQAFNPHLDLKKIKPGSVILVPDRVGEIDFPAGDAKSIGLEAMESFIDFTKDALGDSSKRVKQAADRAKAEEAALADAVKSKDVQRAVASDPALKALVDATVKQAKSDSKSTAAGVKAFDTMAKAAQNELAELAKRLG